MSRARLETLTGYRGVAALAIVVFHAAIAFAPGSNLVHLTRTFPAAVSFFFVLSGFVLTWSWTGSSLSRFWRDRSARILPVYVLAWVLAVAGLAWLRWTPSQTEMLTSLLLLQAWVPGDHFAVAVNVPAWSLSCELAFYAALPFVAPRLLAAPERQLRRAGVATGGWTVVAALLVLWLPLLWWPPVRAPEFLAGVLLAVWMRRGWRPGPRTRMIGVVATMVFVALTVSPLGVAQAVLPPLAVPACLWLIATTAQRDLARAPADRSKLTSVLRPLGQWSYPLYLTHWVVVVLISRFLLGPWWIPLAVLASVAVAAAVHLMVEAPAQVAWRSPRIARDVDLPTPLPSVEASGP
ncbi:MAG: hypothetical protein QOE01_180 [Actinomycetota bacterium]|nr:hypothetical protein [Actinomycetota bacterium]